MDQDQERVFALDMGLGNRLNVYVTDGPENYTVMFSDPDRPAFISIAKCDWERIVERVKAQF